MNLHLGGVYSPMQYVCRLSFFSWITQPRYPALPSQQKCSTEE